MKTFPFVLIAIVSGLLCCRTEDDPNPETKPQTADLYDFKLEVGGSVFETQIQDNEIVLKRLLPFNTKKVRVNLISTSENTIVNIEVGDSLSVGTESVVISVKNTINNLENEYSLSLGTKPFGSVVEQNGLLQVSGNRIVNKNNEPVSFAGNSFFWANNNWGGERYYNKSVVSWLALDFETTIVRAAMGVEDDGGYLSDSIANINRVIKVVDAAIDQGLYVIIDWHSHHAEQHEQDAIMFFQKMAEMYGSYDNVIYEIYNEPLAISWSGVLKPYAEHVIQAIREIDPDNMIVVGTPEWSQRVDLPANDPITVSDNIAYTLHFYSALHQQWLRDRASSALSDGIALFVTEWGSVGYTMNDPETDKWMIWCKENKLTHCNWAVNDKAEEWSILKVGANVNGKWTEGELSEAGKLTRSIVRSWQQE